MLVTRSEFYELFQRVEKIAQQENEKFISHRNKTSDEKIITIILQSVPTDNPFEDIEYLSVVTEGDEWVEPANKYSHQYPYAPGIVFSYKLTSAGAVPYNNDNIVTTRTKE